LLALAYAVLCALLLWHIHRYPSIVPSTDASAYLTYALRFRADGLLSDFGNIRTYGYPLFVYGVSFVFGREPTLLALSCGAIQAALYGAAVYWLSFIAAERDVLLSRAIRLGLLLNPFLVSVVVDLLTDGATLTILIALVCITLRCGQSRQFWPRAAWMAAGALLSNAALMIRPANFTLIVAWNLAVAFSLFKQEKAARARECMAYALFWMASASVLWLPQLLYNVNYLGAISILPICPLGDLQLGLGIISLKHETAVISGVTTPLYFPNPWFNGVFPNGSFWLWYLENPFAGALTILAHVFSSFNVDHLFVYIYAFPAPYSVPLTFAGWTLVILGYLSGASRLKNSLMSLRQKKCSLDLVAALALVVVAVILAIAINGVVQAETRYNTVPLAMASVFGVEIVLRRLGRPNQLILPVAIALLMAVGASVVSERITSRATTTFPVQPKEAERLAFACFHARPSRP
jgi:hypothetical protein